VKKIPIQFFSFLAGSFAGYIPCFFYFQCFLDYEGNYGERCTFLAFWWNYGRWIRNSGEILRTEIEASKFTRYNRLNYFLYPISLVRKILYNMVMVIIFDINLQEVLVIPLVNKKISLVKFLFLKYYKEWTHMTALLTILHLLRDNYGPLKEVDLEFRVIQLSNLFRMVPYYLYEIHQKLLIYF
jgi:hypothetical protein